MIMPWAVVDMFYSHSGGSIGIAVEDISCLKPDDLADTQVIGNA